METEKKYKILIVDDSRFNRLVITSMLAKDYFLEEACDGKQATRILQDSAEEFSLVLLDIVMPNMDGFEFLKVMKEQGWLDFLPVIMISSEYTPENIERAYNLGASELIRRPYDEQIIRHRIANTIALSGRQRALSSALMGEALKEYKNSTAVVAILSHIVELRNGESGAHVQNIRNITAMLLEELEKQTNQYSLSREEMIQITAAASLHDIGKMAVPTEILNKPGKLTSEEFQVIKGHTLAGAAMIEPLLQQADANPLIKLTYEICRWHHERYDGRGYPDGLKGDEIPISAQMVSVADVYDALTSERCYKEAYTPEQAMQMIREGQCGAFNPLLLECLNAVVDRLTETPDPAADMDWGSIDAKQNLVADILANSYENGLSFSDRIAQTLRRDRLRAKFFFNEPYPAFCYTVSPPTLLFNKTGRELCGLDESEIAGMELTEYEGYDATLVDALKSKLTEATNEHPLVTAELTLSLCKKAPPRRYRCVMQTIWDSHTSEHYSEVVGRLIPLESEDDAASPGDIMQKFLPSGNTLTGVGAYYMICALKFMVYNVRLVDPFDSSVIEIDSSGRMSKSDHCCYEIWKQSRKCHDCTSSKCMNVRTEFSKVVFYEGEVFHVNAQYVKVDGIPLVLEMLNRITEHALFDGSGRKLPAESIPGLYNAIYFDPVTNIYNRRYYDEMIQKEENVGGLAVIRVEHIEEITRLCGRAAGDEVLQSVAEVISRERREKDTVVRYDGNEFVMVFSPISLDVLERTLDKICINVSALPVGKTGEGKRVSVSIGGAVGPNSPTALMREADEKLHEARKSPGIGEM